MDLISVLGIRRVDVQVSDKLLDPECRRAAPNATFFEVGSVFIVALIGRGRSRDTIRFSSEPTITTFQVTKVSANSPVRDFEMACSYLISYDKGGLHIELWRG